MHQRTIRSLLIANRGEIAVRIARTAAELGMHCVAVYSEDDDACGHIGFADHGHALRGVGAAAYLDADQLIAAAKQHQCDAIHPGYGFLSENADFAQRCAQHGIVFIGPHPDTLTLFGDKLRARAFAQEQGVPVNAGSNNPVTLTQAREFFASLPTGQAMMIKAVAGGGGKGMRIVRSLDAIDSAYQRCRQEAVRAFGHGAVYVEQLLENARHIEVQIVGDGNHVCHLWDRDCTLQRNQQKLVEIAPAPALDEELRQQLHQYATALASASRYQNLGTFEFLVQGTSAVFLEANPRLQVEHTVTEEIFGLDLVHLQLQLAGGTSLRELNLPAEPPRGSAVQLRINMESMDALGNALPSGGTISQFTPPTGPGVRVDSFIYPGYTTVSRFDSLMAKLIISSSTKNTPRLLQKAHRALREFAVDGVATNREFLLNLLANEHVQQYQVHTRFVEQQIGAFVPAVERADDSAYTIRSPMQGVVTAINVAASDQIHQGTELALIEAMKLEHAIVADTSGTIVDVAVTPGTSTAPGDLLIAIEPTPTETTQAANTATQDLDAIREDVQEVCDRIAQTLDRSHPSAVAKRRSRGQRTARENIADLIDAGSFCEYGQLAVVYLHSRKSIDELRESTPADGFVAGTATVNAQLFGDEASAVAVGSYDATVMAGTQGHKNHQKSDRLFDLARDQTLPLVLFAEGGGGRPREDPVTIAALQNETFRKLAELSGQVPVVGVVSGRCFAGNAALLGMADVIIATENSNIGMAGPALIEAGGLGSFAPEDVGPIDVQHGNGVVDIRVKDEAEAVQVTKQYLSYFQGNLDHWQAHDERKLRHAIPESRLRAYDVRAVINLLADVDSVLELRSAFGRAYVTALARVEGRPLGIIANNPGYNSGAIDSDSADKAARFIRLCNAHNLPILSLIDTPGIMVGPDAEAKALVRHSARLFVTAASLRVLLFAIVLRKAYGLGAMAAAGGHFHAPVFTVSWPTGELGGMGLEGGVRLAYKKELEAIADPAERQAFFEKRVASRYRKGKASFIASYFELDAVIDPAESRRWIVRGMKTTHTKKQKQAADFIDAW